MNIEKVINVVKQHLASQVVKSNRLRLDGTKQCYYRLQLKSFLGKEFKDDDGPVLKCGMGALIPDELYNHRWDVRDYLDGAPDVDILLTGSDPSMVKLQEYWLQEYQIDKTEKDRKTMMEIQVVHDDHDQAQWIDLLDEVQRRYLLA